ncbi:hypothetical protein QAD02_016486 [Eretmocerus hayati]|uniref:Uncharacterized protein n=1 Tax=Eretmocerus hayati TaxID=131215 RepID=A0ACC2PBM7_9HYME|nr:hypothetical protein QAD02_016486 [Eretmocerus hayati]
MATTTPVFVVNQVSSENNSTNFGIATCNMKTSAREMNRQQKLINTANLANFVKPGLLTAPSSARKVQSGSRPSANNLSEKLVVPQTGFVKMISQGQLLRNVSNIPTTTATTVPQNIRFISYQELMSRMTPKPVSHPEEVTTVLGHAQDERQQQLVRLVPQNNNVPNEFSNGAETSNSNVTFLMDDSSEQKENDEVQPYTDTDIDDVQNLNDIGGVNAEQDCADMDFENLILTDAHPPPGHEEKPTEASTHDINKPLPQNCCLVSKDEIRLLLAKIEANNQLLKELLQMSKDQQERPVISNDAGEIAIETVIPDLPLRTLDQLTQFSEKLRTDRQLLRDLINQLMDLRDTDFLKGISQMMSHIISDHVADKYIVWSQPKRSSLTPEKKLKTKVKDLYIMKVVTYAVKKSYPNEAKLSTQVLIAKCLKNWVNKSSDRVRSAAIAQNKKRQEQQLPNQDDDIDDELLQN